MTCSESVDRVRSRRGRQRQAAFPAGRYDCHGSRRRRADGGAVPGILEAERARAGARRAGRSGHQQARAGRDDQGELARPGDLHRAAARRKCAPSWTAPSSTAQLRDPESEESEQPPYAKNERARAQARVSRAGRRLHAPRLRAAEPLPARRRGARRRLAGRLLLPVPRLEVRSRRPRVQGRAGAAQPAKCRRTASSTKALVQIGVDAEVSLMSATVPSPQPGERSRLGSAGRLDRRALPDDAHVEGARERVLRAEELQLLVLLRRRSRWSCW